MPNLAPGVLLVSTALTACGGTASIQCDQSSTCDLHAGGFCAAAGTGNRWCSYPDPTCPSGYRYSTFQVGDGLAGVCVGLMPDAGVDAPDAPDAAVGPPMGWAKSFGSTGNDAFNGIALGSNDEIVAVGSFEGSVTFGNASFTSKGAADGVVVKFDATGKYLWAKMFGGPTNDGVRAVALDQAGNVYIMGSFGNSIDIDGMTLTPKGTANSGDYIAKLDGTTGSRIWAFGFGGLATSTFLTVDSIALSADGTRLAASGQFNGTANFGGADIAQAGGGDVFVAVYATADGAHVWSRGFGGTGIDEASGVAFDGNDGVIIAGTYSGPASFGGAQPLSAHGTFPSADVFVARYTASNGAYEWASGYGSTGSDQAQKVRVSGGAAYVAGTYAPPPSMGISLGGDQLMCSGTDCGFVAKYDAATGSHIWSKGFGAQNGDAKGRDLAVTDQVWTAIRFSGPIQIGDATYTSVGISDVAFISLSSSTGLISTSGAFGGPSADSSEGIVASSTALCIAGTFGLLTPSAGTTTTTVFGNPLSGAGETDAFIGCKAP